MAAERRMDADADELGQGDTRRTLIKRRGLIAGAAALMTGVLARQTTQPVEAFTGDDWVLGRTNYADTTTYLTSYVDGYSGHVLTVYAYRDRDGQSAIEGVGGRTGNGVTGVGGTNGGDGVTGFATGNGTGVDGEGGDGSGFGVTGFGGRTGGIGVLGRGGINGNGAGVQAFGSGNAAGIFAQGGPAQGTGVLGRGGPNGQGVAGLGVGNGPGVVGVADGSAPNANADGVQGFGIGTYSGVAGFGGGKGGSGVFGLGGGPNGDGLRGQGTGNGAGVRGTSASSVGVQGESTSGHGVVGTTTATDGQHAALIGYVQPGGNAIGLRASIPSGASGLAGVFDGDVVISGALRVYGSPKNAAVKHPDGTHRLLYCVESPESWFEDFGRGKLKDGRAEVRLDGDFAALVHGDDYHVFLTETGGTHHLLSVERADAAGFAVVADAEGAATRGKKASDLSGTFSYRVVARRKDIKGERLAKVAPPPALPAVSAHTDDPTRSSAPPPFAKAPEPPQPAKRPESVNPQGLPKKP